jgi:tripartite-type tricarboxylate transporter receptor subunit TctC
LKPRPIVGKDFDLVSLAVLTTLVITVHPSVPARTLQDFVALIKANPGKYSYASPGTGTPGHLVGETFRLSLGLDLVHVPFNSAGLAVGSAVGGHTQICFASPSPAAQQVIEGKLRGLAVTSKTRSQALPTLPTTTELGYPDVMGDNWQGLVVPAGTPKQIIAFLHSEIVKIVALPDIRERLAVLGFEPVASTPEEFAQHVTVAEAPNRFAVHLDVGDDIDFRQALDEPAAIFLDRRHRHVVPRHAAQSEHALFS